MTAEDFNGMLMAALHGPNAPAIVHRIAEVALQDEALTQQIGGLLGAAIGENADVESLTDLEMFAHIAAKKPEQPRDAIALAVAKSKVVERIRDRLRAGMRRSEAGRTVAASILLDLDPEPQL